MRVCRRSVSPRATPEASLSSLSLDGRYASRDWSIFQASCVKRPLISVPHHSISPLRSLSIVCPGVIYTYLVQHSSR